MLLRVEGFEASSHCVSRVHVAQHFFQQVHTLKVVVLHLAVHLLDDAFIQTVQDILVLRFDAEDLVGKLEQDSVSHVAVVDDDGLAH